MSKTRTCPECAKQFSGEIAVSQHRRDKHGRPVSVGQHMAMAAKRSASDEAFEPQWGNKCMVCDATPTVGTTGLCGPCCFGEAATAGGEW